VSEFIEPHFKKWRIHRNHRVVDPDIDGSKSIFYSSRRCFDLFELTDVGRKHQSLAAKIFDFGARGFKAIMSPSQQSNAGAPLTSELSHQGATHTSRGTGYNNHAPESGTVSAHRYL